MKEALSGGNTTATSTIHPIAQKVIAEAKRIVDSGYQEGPNNDKILVSGLVSTLTHGALCSYHGVSRRLERHI